MTRDVSTLTAEQAGVVVGWTLLGSAVDDPLPVSGPAHDACRRLLRGLATRGRHDRATAVAELTAQHTVGSLQRQAAEVTRWVHPSWIVRALRSEPPGLAVLLIDDAWPIEFHDARHAALVAQGLEQADVPVPRPAPEVLEDLRSVLLEELWPPCLCPAGSAEADHERVSADRLPGVLASRGSAALAGRSGCERLARRLPWEVGQLMIKARR